MVRLACVGLCFESRSETKSRASLDVLAAMLSCQRRCDTRVFSSPDVPEDLCLRGHRIMRHGILVVAGLGVGHANVLARAISIFSE